VQSGFASVVTAISTHAVDSAAMHAQVGADATKYYLDAHGMANEAPRAYVAPNSLHCATTYVIALGDQLELFTHALAQTTMKMIRDRDTGTSATTGAGVQGQAVCESVAPFADPKRYSASIIAAFQAACGSSTGTAPTQLLSGSMDIGMLFDRVQFIIPPQPTTTKNNHIIWDTTQFSSSDPWWYVAAWRFCENFVPNAPPPPNGANNTATLNDLMRAGADARTAVYKMGPLRECMQALAERTACPSSGSGGNGNPTVQISNVGTVDCWQIQNIACHRLKDPFPSGLGIKDVHNEEVNTALQNCDTNGLSYKAYMYVWSHRCADPTFMSQGVPAEYSDNARSRAEVGLCDSSLKLYDHLFGEDERSNFYEALELFLMGPGGGQTNPAGQAAYPSS
jgi:hypothetical protein